MKIKKLAQYIFGNKKLMLLLAAINVIGFFYGIYYYQPQLIETPAYLWIFTLDSPIPVALFAAICGLRIANKRIPDLLVLFAIIGLIKYGLWTDMVLAVHWNYFFSFSPLITSLNLPLHFGMILEGIVLFYLLKKIDRTKTLVAMSFFLFNDFLDYFFGTVTRIPTMHMNIFMYEAFLSTIIISGLVYFRKSHF